MRKEMPYKRNWLSNWPQWSGYGAAIWALCYGILSLYWTLGGEGYPYADPVVGALTPLISNVEAIVAGPIITSICLIAFVVALAAGKHWGQKIPRAIILGFSWSMCVGLLLLGMGAILLSYLGYAFLLRFQFSWVALNQGICLLGAIIWGLASLAYQRKSRHACQHCGRSETTPSHNNNRGKWIAYVAALMALPYGISRFLWGLNIPFLVRPEFASLSGETSGIHITELTFGILFFSGAILTLGLSQHWGEIFPRWLPGLAGKRVPPALAIIPASLVSLILIQGGTGLYHTMFFGDFLTNTGSGRPFLYEWGAWAPALFWLPWGILLAAATIAYYYRRRGQCQYCGRGIDESQNRKNSTPKSSLEHPVV